MSTFMGLLSAGRPPPRVIVLEGLGAAEKPKKGKAKADKPKARKPRRAGAPPPQKPTKTMSPAKKAAKGKKASKSKPRKSSSAPSPAKAEVRIIKVKGGLRNQPLNDHHSPFKRSSIRPGGPRGVESQQTGVWTCDRVQPYVQRCVSSIRKRDGKLKVKTVKLSEEGIKNKLAYNKAYRQHIKKLGKPKFANKASALYKYRKTKWAGRAK